MPTTKRKITKESAEAVIERDELCIICQMQIQEIHHAFFGAINANLKENRNSPEELVWLCRTCHEDIHKWGNQKKRKFCEDYLYFLSLWEKLEYKICSDYDEWIQDNRFFV